MQVVLGLKLVSERLGPGQRVAEVGLQLAADGRVAGLRGRDVGADFVVGVAEGPGREEVEDFGVGEDGGLGVEDLVGC